MPGKNQYRSKIKTTELEFKGQIQGWVNEILAELGHPFESASSESSIKVSGKVRHPDLVIWVNLRARQAFANFEFKTPSIAADDPDLFKNALENARGLNTQYFLTFNLCAAYLWKTPHPGQEISVSQHRKIWRPDCQISSEDDFQNANVQAHIKEKLREMILDLVQLYKDGSLFKQQPDIFFVNKITHAAQQLFPHLKDILSEKFSEREFRNKLNQWATEQGIVNFGDEASFEILARQMAYRLLGKILFYQTLRRYQTSLPPIDIGQTRDFTKRLQQYFSEALGIDYQAVFIQDIPDQIPLPKQTHPILLNLIADLQEYDFSSLPQEIVGSIFEKMIPPEERHRLGQYFTPENLVDLILAFTIRGANDYVLDPACGSGTFLIRAYDRFKAFGKREHKELLTRIWGVDIAPFPAELATINLFRQNLSDYANFPRVVVKDFFTVRAGQEFEFPPPKPTGDRNAKLKEKIPDFDAAFGNFPFIRQELIEKAKPGNKAALERVIGEDWRAEYPELFKKGQSLNLSGQADIYAYLFFHTARFLKPDGRMGFITSNSWLDVAYGFELQKFFLKKFKLVAVLESRCEPWFEEAAVNTIVTVLERCDDKESRANNQVKFVKIKKPLKDLIPWDMQTEWDQRWAGLNRIVNTVELADQKAKPLASNIKCYEDDNFRIRLLSQKDLLSELEQTGETVKWGKYLRAPDVYFEILEKCQDKLVPLKEIADVRRGFTTGINEFFYLDDEKIKQWKIEKEFLVPIFKSPTEFEEISVDPRKLELKAFFCKRSKSELQKSGMLGALGYIKWAEKQKNKDGIFYPDIPSVLGRKYWYSIDIVDDEIVWPSTQREKLRNFYNKNRCMIDKVMYGISPKDGHSKTLLALLNSSLIFLWVEVNPSLLLAPGGIFTTVDDVAKMLVPFIKNSSKFDSYISKPLDSLINKKIKSIFEEIKMEDRRELDSLVLDALGLDPREYLDRIYEGLCKLVRERIELARMRGKVKGGRVKIKRDEEKLKQNVIDEFITDLGRRFPESFLDKKYLSKPEAIEISITNKPMSIDKPMFNFHPVIAEDGYKYEAKSIDEAKFIIYSQASALAQNSLVIPVPNSQTIIRKAVHDYEQHIKKVSQEINALLSKRSGDFKLAERMTIEILDEFGIRLI